MNLNFKYRDKITLIFDMDDVLCCTQERIKYILKKEYNKDVKMEDLTQWDYQHTWGKECYEILEQKGFYLDLDIKNDAREIFPKFYNNPNYDVIIVTAGNDISIPERRIWLTKNFPDFDNEKLYQCKEKWRIIGDFLIDDSPNNVIEFGKNGGKSIVYDMPYNRTIKNIKRVHNLSEVYSYIEAERLSSKKTKKFYY